MLQQLAWSQEKLLGMSGAHGGRIQHISQHFSNLTFSWRFIFSMDLRAGRATGGVDFTGLACFLAGSELYINI